MGDTSNEEKNVSESTLLEVCERERAEYLDGWQRARAEVANIKKEMVSEGVRMKRAGQEDMLHNIIPALDSFFSAFESAGWNSVDPAWKSGVEYIYQQFQQALSTFNITAFGAIGEIPDPSRYEILGEEAGEGVPGTVSRVVRPGYEREGRVLRPVHVIVFKT